MALCCTCRVDKDDDQFWRRKGRLQPNCIPCQSDINKQRYAANPKRQIAAVKRNNDRRYEAYVAWKATLKCSCCPESYGPCLDFHHLDPSQKDFEISSKNWSFSEQRLIDELRKCAVVCSNCHTKVHNGLIDNSGLSPVSEDDIQRLISTRRVSSSEAEHPALNRTVEISKFS